MSLLNDIKQPIKKYLVTISLATIICALFLIVGAVPEMLYFNQAAVSKGETWRLFTAHLVHSDGEHLMWNLGAFLILSLLIEQQSRVMLLISLLAGTLAIDVYLWFNTIGVTNYAGFSGVLNTLLVIALYQPLQRNNKSLGLACILSITIYFASLSKILIEFSSQQALFSDTSWQALPQVHGIGFIMGTLLVMLIIVAEKSFSLHPNPHHNSG